MTYVQGVPLWVKDALRINNLPVARLARP